jgi:UDP-N-acetylglucosamine--N-acetylmuramyl-(pentapeptide) pyrophosphoryl-undecaprenol N-acetylglucosamine transferase
MAVADALSALDPDVRITALGTRRGLETRLVPERGYDLELITPVPLPRKLSGDLLRLPLRVRRAVKETRAVLDDVDADVVVGFGGYVAVPAYLAARRRRVPVVVHEANACAGWANKVGARSASRVLSAVPEPGLRRAEVVGVPVRAAITSLDRMALRAEARSRSTEPSPQPPKILPQAVFRCCTRMVRKTRWICASPRRVTRPMSPSRIWTGWIWPTPRLIWRCAGRGR